MNYYLIFVWGDVEPHTHGPFAAEAKRDEKALELRKQNGDQHGYYPAVIKENSILEVGAYSSGFFAGME